MLKYIERLYKCYKNAIIDINEVTKNIIKGLIFGSVVMVATLMTAGMLAPKIAVLLVGSHFTGLSGAALTSACLAYLGGGAVAVGGAGMAGGTVAIVGGGAILGAGAGFGLGGSIAMSKIINKDQVIKESAKLIVSIREIFLNDEKDLHLSNTLYEEYVKKISEMKHGLVDLKEVQENEELTEEEKKEIKHNIKEIEESIKKMEIAKNNLKKFKSSFEIGMKNTED